jgi:hypothetical protein
MEKLIFEYLNSTYPEIYRKLTKFGYTICGYDDKRNWFFVRYNMTRTIMSLFCCDCDTAESMINKWIDTLRVVNNIYLSDLEREWLLIHYNISC